MAFAILGGVKKLLYGLALLPLLSAGHLWAAAEPQGIQWHKFYDSAGVMLQLKQNGIITGTTIKLNPRLYDCDTNYSPVRCSYHQSAKVQPCALVPGSGCIKYYRI